jgi:pimeloyl-ACP methyl ester carboxylesterase
MPERLCACFRLPFPLPGIGIYSREKRKTDMEGYQMKKTRINKIILSVMIIMIGLSYGVLADASDSLPAEEGHVIEKLIPIGQYHLNFKVIEGGKRTILLESGGGMDSTEWDDLAPQLWSQTGATIIFYDRAGFGKSDLPETTNSDMRQEMNWLWQGLGALEKQSDLVLVGHSFGGWLIRLLASDYPEAVLGLVFVDPFTNELVERMGIDYLDNHPMSGKLPFDTSQPEKLTKMQRALIRMVGKGLAPKMKIMMKTAIPQGIPVTVITSGKPFLPKPEEQKAWRLAHEQFAASIDGAKLVIAEESSHMIPFSQPNLIIQEVMDVIGRIDDSNNNE